MTTRYICDVCGATRDDMGLGSLMGEGHDGGNVWTMTLCGATDCLVTALTKMHEPQGIRTFRYFRPYEPISKAASDAQV